MATRLVQQEIGAKPHAGRGGNGAVIRRHHAQAVKRAPQRAIRLGEDVERAGNVKQLHAGQREQGNGMRHDYGVS